MPIAFLLFVCCFLLSRTLITRRRSQIARFSFSSCVRSIVNKCRVSRRRSNEQNEKRKKKQKWILHTRQCVDIERRVEIVRARLNRHDTRKRRKEKQSKKNWVANVEWHISSVCWRFFSDRIGNTVVVSANISSIRCLSLFDTQRKRRFLCKFTRTQIVSNAFLFPLWRERVEKNEKKKLGRSVDSVRSVDELFVLAPKSYRK